MRFLADENVPLQVCELLAKRDIDIVSVSEASPGASDQEIILLAKKEQRAIITFDKDFGEWAFKAKVKTTAIILLRVSPRSPEFISDKIKALLSDTSIPLEKHFTVVEETRVRTRKLK